MHPSTSPVARATSAVHRLARAATAALVVLGASLAPALAPLPATAAEGPSVSVAPAAELVDGQVVRVTWAGFPADTPVLVRQCTGAASIAADCTSALTNGGTRSDGTGSTSFQVATGTLESRIPCDFRTACRIGVFADTGTASASPSPDSASAGTPTAFAEVRFAFPPDACPAATGETLTASGASAPTRAVTAWQGTLCRSAERISFDYTVKNSVDGARDVAGGLRDTAVTAQSLPEEDLAALRAAGKPIAYAPLTVSGLVFAYRLQDRVTGEQITDLRLTPALAAQLLTGQILQWNDQRVRALNPGKAFPVSVRAVARADNSATTRQLTGWFMSTARAAYEAGGDAYKRAGVTDTYPSTGDVDLRTGARSVALQVARPSQDTDPSSFGYIGVMDSSTADLFGLDVARIANGSGAFVAPDATSLNAALAVARKGADGVLVPDPKAGGAGYPMPVVGYLAVPTRGLSAAKVTVAQAVLDHAAGAGQKELPGGYVPLTPALVAQTKAVRASVQTGTAAPAPAPAEPPAEGGAPPPSAAPTVPDGPIDTDDGDLAPLPDFGGPVLSEPLPVDEGGVTGGPTGGPFDGVLAGEGTGALGPLDGLGTTTTGGAAPATPEAAPPTGVVLSSAIRVPEVVASSPAGLVLPLLAAIGLFALVAGPALQWAAVRAGRAA